MSWTAETVVNLNRLELVVLKINLEISELDCATLPASTYNGDGSTCATVICCPPIGACCLSDGQCLLTSADQCDSVNGIYAGDGVTCVNIGVQLPLP